VSSWRGDWTCISTSIRRREAFPPVPLRTRASRLTPLPHCRSCKGKGDASCRAD
jgi:hypothetical protein